MALEKETADSKPLGVLGLFFESETFSETEINLYSNHDIGFQKRRYCGKILFRSI